MEAQDARFKPIAKTCSRPRGERIKVPQASDLGQMFVLSREALRRRAVPGTPLGPSKLPDLASNQGGIRGTLMTNKATSSMLKWVDINPRASS